MEVARSGVSVLGDGSIACVRPQKISRQRAVAGYRWVRRLGGILVLWQEGRAIGYYQIGLAGDIIGEAEARGNLDATILGEIFADSMASLEDSVGDVARPGHNTADIKTRQSVIGCCARADRYVTSDGLAANSP